jgi:cytochrome o ubiquinol oxidase subunit 2
MSLFSHFALLDPKGPIGAEELNIILLATGLMLIVVLPVIGMTFAFAWRYRASNKKAEYKPDWEHSNAIEAVVWIVPCLIIVALGLVTWTSTHKLDPYRPIASDKAAIEVEVVSLDWKWLFIYPDLKIASVNELAFPAGTPVHFRMTSGSVMNSLFVPQLGTMVYTMAGMQTQLSLVADQAGAFEGMSSNFSGDGFSDMKFVARSMGEDDFQSWVEHARSTGAVLSSAVYHELEKPSEKAAAASLRPGLHRPRRDHDLLRGDAARHRADELRRAAADRRARRVVPVPQQFQLLDDGRRRRAGDDVAVRRRVRTHRLARLSRRCPIRPTARTSASTTTSGRCRSPVSARCCPAST